jgi:hypothetical protein
MNAPVKPTFDETLAFWRDLPAKERARLLAGFRKDVIATSRQFHREVTIYAQHMLRQLFLFEPWLDENTDKAS